jgi:hypothetical protein
MIDYTLRAIDRQLTAMNCEYYDIGIHSRETGYTQRIPMLSATSIIDSIGYYKYMNRKGNDIFISCDKSVDRAIVLVDDIKKYTIKEMYRRGFNPACVVETSPQNYQAWISLGPNGMTSSQKTIAAKLIAAEFKGDLRSIDAYHYGRLSGFTNRKQQYLTELGFPYVLCVQSTGQHARKWEEIIDYVIKEEQINILEANNKLIVETTIPINNKNNHIQIYGEYIDQCINHNIASGNFIDPSKCDFAVCCRMTLQGYSNEQISEAMIINSPNIDIRKKGHINDYVNRTVANARERIIGKKQK